MKTAWRRLALVPWALSAPVSAEEPVVAGIPPTAIIQVVPVPAKVGSYPPGTTIVGNELRAPYGGFRAWFEFQVGNWDPDGDGSPLGAGTVQIKIDASGYLDADTSDPGDDVSDDGDQPDLAMPIISCADDAPCVAAFGESWAKCEAGACKPAYADRMGQLPNPFCGDFGSGPCDQADCSSATPTVNCFAITRAPWDPAVYDGSMKGFATLVLDIPSGARGRYTVNLLTDETFWNPFHSPPIEWESLEETGFVVDIQTGACCFDLASDDPQCVGEVLEGECGDDKPGPGKFTPNAGCPPYGPACEAMGACCETIDAVCGDLVLERDCRGEHHLWTAARTCDEVECVADVGACCTHDPFTPCANGVVLADCQCATCTWQKGEVCDEVECPPTAIPALSTWGLAALSLLLMIGAKLVFGRGAEARHALGGGTGPNR